MFKRKRVQVCGGRNISAEYAADADMNNFDVIMQGAELPDFTALTIYHAA